MTVYESVRRFLLARATPGNRDLVSRWCQNYPNMETQLLVTAGNGYPVHGKPGMFTDGVNEWWSIRIPKNAKAEPSFRDYKMNWPLDAHAVAIGSTGWDWRNRKSRWVGFDFDAIAGHALGVGIPDDKLAEIREAVQSVPYVSVRRSTGGKGLHLYVYLDDIATANHIEHTNVAKAVLRRISQQVGFDLTKHVDAEGGNMWIWHRKLEVVK